LNVNDSKLLISNYIPQGNEDLHKMTLRPYEARVYLNQ
jgi:oligo-1,6-glucosidase